VTFKDNFQIFPDQSTIIGVDFENNHKNLMIENIAYNLNIPKTVFGNHEYRIYTIIPDAEFRRILVGDVSGVVIQYKYNSDGNWEIEQNYGNIGVGYVLSSDRLGNICVFGGNNFCFRMIDMDKKKILTYPMQSAMQNIDSIQFCRLGDSKVFLSISGCSPDWTMGDVFDVSFLFKTQNLISLEFDTAKKVRKPKYFIN
jgi:hypothetical protein